MTDPPVAALRAARIDNERYRQAVSFLKTFEYRSVEEA